jgi:hypothetical protein
MCYVPWKLQYRSRIMIRCQHQLSHVIRFKDTSSLAHIKNHILKGEISLHAKFPGEVAFHNEAAPGANKATCFSLPENGHAISVKTKLAVHLYTSSLFFSL